MEVRVAVEMIDPRLIPNNGFPILPVLCCLLSITSLTYRQFLKQQEEKGNMSLLFLTRLMFSVELPLPPGPKGLPIFGNIGDLPIEEQWLKAAEWGKEYGQCLSSVPFRFTNFEP